MSASDPIFLVQKQGKDIAFFKSTECNEIRFLFAEHGCDIKTIKVMFTGLTYLNNAMKELIQRKYISETDADEYEISVISKMLNSNPKMEERLKLSLELSRMFQTLSKEKQSCVIENVENWSSEFAEGLRELQGERYDNGKSA